MTSMRRNNVASMSFRRHVPTRFLINQCQIITILILKSDIIENSRIELREIVLPVPSNQIKLHLLLFYPSTWYICDFFPFHIEIEGKGRWIIGGANGYVAPPPLPNYWGRLAPPLPTLKNLVHGLAFGTPKFYIAPYRKIKHELVNTRISIRNTKILHCALP